MECKTPRSVDYYYCHWALWDGRATSGRPLTCCGVSMTVANCGTLRTMPTAFGSELRRRRESRLDRISRSRLARLSGVSESQISNLETQEVEPHRPTVIALAAAVPNWDIDDALHIAGYEPLTDTERAEMAAPAQDPRDEITEILPRLTDSRALALLYVARSMLDAETRVPAAFAGTRVVLQEGPGVAEPSAAERATRQGGHDDETQTTQNGPHPK